MKKVIILGVVVGFCFISMAQETPSAGFGVKIGTLGPGIEIGMSFTPKIAARLGLNYFTYSYDTTEEGIDYDAGLTLFTLGPVIDWHPTGGSFRVSGGLLYNGNEVTGKAKRDLHLRIGGHEYPNATVKTTVDFDDLSPYVGIGWDTSFGAERQWGLICDLGIIYHGVPHVTLKATATEARIDPEDVRKEKKEIEDAVKSFQWYPVITAGFIYRF
ncbi:MAG: hypothetical protein NC832_01170 [Candidatus Omnitrophica bacterium]|nr:hypothetical protein [Candidatus Omnitrophota bacterium]